MIPRYTRKEMQAVWTEERKFNLWLDVELAVLKVFEEEGRIPRGASQRVRERVKINVSRIQEIENTVRHDVIAFLVHVAEQANPEDVRFLHFGMTSSDVLDTAFALQLREAGYILLDDLKKVGEVIESLMLEYSDAPAVGRTHGIHAEPITLGVKFASWLSETARNVKRMKEAVKEISVGKISGAVGVYGHVSPDLERRALELLGLRPEPVSTQVVPRDRHAAFFTALALCAGMVERIAVEIRHLQRTEVREVWEPFGRGQRGSSAMPHKKNPVLSENITGLARLVRSYTLAALENMPLWHERDISHSSVERVIAPDATIATDFMLNRLKNILEGLQVDVAQAVANLNLTRGLVFSESVLLALIDKGLSRDQAYILVQRNALKCWDEGGEFLEYLKADEEIMSYLSAEELDKCFDMKHALRHTGLIIDRVREEWKKVLEVLN